MPVLGLVRRGGLDLDRSLDAYLSQPYPIDDARGRHITARHVLTHTSGLPNWRDERSPSLTLAFAPGTAYRYSGEGFYFLQTVVEAVSGLSMGKFMRGALDGLSMSFFHTGANPGFKAAMFGDVTGQRGIASFTNSDGGFVFNMHAIERALGAQPAIFWLEQP